MHEEDEWYTFVWKPAHDPYMITPEGMLVVLEQKGYIPYLKVGSSHCALFRPDDKERFPLHNGGRHYMAAPAEGDAGERGDDPPGVFPVEGPEPDLAEEPAVADVDVDDAVDQALGIDVDDVYATDRECAKMVEHQLTHLPPNRHCEACLRCKMQQLRHYMGASNRSLTKFGQIVTLDLWLPLITPSVWVSQVTSMR